LKKQFTFFKKEDDRLTAKGKAFESQLIARQKALDGLKMRFQERYQAGTASAEEMMNLENEIKRKEQQFMTFQQTQGAALETETNESLESLTKKIEAAGKKYCEKYGIDLLLIHGQGGQINFINKKMDVTRSFIDYLNYEQQLLEKDMGK
jgi:Skp family chaperone for outer membrane proteins